MERTQSPRGVKLCSVIAFCAIILSPIPSWAAATISTLQGEAKILNPVSKTWVGAVSNYILTPGEEVRTESRSKLTLAFDDGSKVEIGPKSSFLLEKAEQAETSMRLSFGKMKAWVSRLANRQFAVRTPTAVCSVRGTEFGVQVAANGATQVDLFKGSLGVSDSRGNETLLQEGQRIGVDQRGLGQAIGLDEAAAQKKAEERSALKREVGLEMTKEDIQAAAAAEQKNAVYQQGKVMVDVNGNRVRLEEYIIRPEPNQFKLVVLNHRADRFDYFYYKGVFNTALPTDLRVAFQQLPGCVGAACQFYLTEYETGRSNTIDNVLENASGGVQRDVNNNADATDDVASFFDPARNDFSGVAPGVPFFKTIYPTYALKFNGVSHLSWNYGGVIAGFTSQNQVADVNAVGLVQGANCDTLDNCTGNRDPGFFHDIVYEATGGLGGGAVWDKWDSYVIDDEGKVAKHSDFANITSGADYKERLLKWNYQQIITASEFNGRKIDLVYEPKILIESGLIP
ncbi:MAG: hypothetical protein A2X36_13315 [Elusimicrobia bacterium GWA2_69_24]|nr:MAG: hypothetical protein A2X36_13315 [Elusimicrobia bacterium GWA2_69_24]